MSLDELCPVRPGDHESGEGPLVDQEEDHQDRAYRNAVESFNPDEAAEEEKQMSGEADAHEEDEMQEGGEQEGEGQRSRATTMPKAPTAREWE